MDSIRQELSSLGISLAAIGNGTVEQLRNFEELFNFGFPIYTDPTLTSFRTFGLKRKFGIGPRAIYRYLKVLAKGYRQSWTQGDKWQQAGVVIVDEDLKKVWSHINDGPGDHANLDEIVAQVSNHQTQQT